MDKFTDCLIIKFDRGIKKYVTTFQYSRTPNKKFDTLDEAKAYAFRCQRRRAEGLFIQIHY